MFLGLCGRERACFGSSCWKEVQWPSGEVAGATLPLVGVEMCLGMFVDVCAHCHHLFVLRMSVEGVGVCLGRCEARETNNLKVERAKLIIEGQEIDN